MSGFEMMMQHLFPLLEVLKVKELPGRGRGLVASRAIPRGSTVLLEEPLIMVEKKQGANAEVRRQYQGLAKAQRQHYDSLSPEITSKQGRVEKIFWKNCLQFEREDRVAMFSRYWKPLMDVTNTHPRFALVNHSCAGNAVINFTDTGLLQLVVVRRVEKEEEITVNYLDPYIFRWQVWTSLEWNFLKY